MIYFIVTTSLYDNSSLRESQYIDGINRLKKVIKDLSIENYKLIVVENNGTRNTILNTIGCEIYYTKNNFLKTNNKGYKELQDILDCIDKYNIDDNDFIVKMTGRYILNNNSEFMTVIKNINDTKYDCVIKYGPFYNPVKYKMDDCITGLIGMSCFYIKLIEKPVGDNPVEWNWAKVTRLIDDKKIHLVNTLGIYINPGNNNYFMV